MVGIARRSRQYNRVNEALSKPVCGTLQSAKAPPGGMPHLLWCKRIRRTFQKIDPRVNRNEFLKKLAICNGFWWFRNRFEGGQREMARRGGSIL
jgi:hypothetical protein